jgi:hypothetical protein
MTPSCIRSLEDRVVSSLDYGVIVQWAVDESPFRCGPDRELACPLGDHVE